MKTALSASKHTSRRLVAALGLLCCLPLTGCSDNPTGGTNLKPGDPGSPQFNSVNSVLGSEAFALTGIHWHGLVEDELPGTTRSRSRLGTPAHDTVLSAVVTVDSATGWIVIEATAADHGDTIEFVDSVRFYRNGEPAIPSDSLPVDSMSAVDVHIRGHLHADDSSEFVGHAAHASWIHLEVLDRDPGLGTTTFQLNLTAVDTVHGTAWDSTWGECDVDVTAQRAITNLVEVETHDTGHHPVRGLRSGVWQALGAHEGCPLSGSVALNMDVYLDCTGGETEVTVDADWTVSAAFHGGDEVTVTFRSGDFYWTRTVDCAEIEEL